MNSDLVTLISESSASLSVTALVVGVVLFLFGRSARKQGFIMKRSAETEINEVISETTRQIETAQSECAEQVAEARRERDEAAAEAKRERDDGIALARRERDDGISRADRERDDVLTHYSEIIELDSAVATARSELGELASASSSMESDIKTSQNLIAELNGKLDELENGFYQPKFDTRHPNIFKQKIYDVRKELKETIKIAKKTSMYHSDNYGETNGIFLTFQILADKAIREVTWKNIATKEKFIRGTAVRQANKIQVGTWYNHIPSEVVELKVKELHMHFELALKEAEQKEDARIAAKLRREDEAVAREIQQAIDEETKLEGLLEKARQAVNKDTEAYRSKIAELESALADAHTNAERAKSMAEQTRMGHVYVISNIGSFGEEVFKIGMTRRLEPMDRVKELGDASVPFTFDVHGMIYTKDAPALEKALHRAFDERRVNKVNLRKEFFNVTLKEIQAVIEQHAPEAELYEDAAAVEYYASLMTLEEAA